ncbi:ATP-binding cassette domain-containing protein [Labrys wisconsinensis]|uniref:Ribose transport system ATP-binding protein n=1 Tax=Labrys wisconsinensis TaxID=425677 RepID=A0ABU0JF03_9HYPH|nr:ATP-binding cassette domain-containing protein [Labrys wisconsinensis]MDQ0471854.1 ribose transport system ATP-binding protein [Labrys wisconsinensis]
MPSDTLLEARDLRLRPEAEPFDERVAPGEIVGLAGLDGHGQEAFLKTLAGLARPAAGEVRLDGRPLAGFRQAVARGLAYVPRDRRATGIFPTLSVLDNFAIATAGADTRLGFIAPRRRRSRFEAHVRRLSINAPDWRAPITTLSGGNQQKVLLARALALQPRALLLNDPTRGVDVATRHVLYDVFRGLAAEEGLALVILSSKIEEILALCGRVLVFREQALAARLGGADMTGAAVIAAMFGRAA